MRRWKLFLDDERYPIFEGIQDLFQIARNFDDAVWMVENYGIPYHMSLDHDLGSPGNRTGMDFVKWFAEYVLENELDLPPDFTYYVHSQNPVGADNMRAYLEQFIDHMGYSF